MARDNPRWGEERIAKELLFRISPRTIRKYTPKLPKGKPRGDQRWSTYIRNHAKGIVASDFCIAVTATFRLFYVFVVMEHSARRLLHVNVTAHPTAAWTLQQLRHAIPGGEGYRFLIHDRDAIFSTELDRSIRNLSLRALRTPYRSPQASAICERMTVTMRREEHRRGVVRERAARDNVGRPHMRWVLVSEPARGHSGSTTKRSSSCERTTWSDRTLCAGRASS